MYTAALLSLVAATFAGDLDRAVTSVVSDLKLSSVDGFDLGADLGVVVRMDGAPDRAAVAPLIRGIVTARLEQLGASAVLAVPVVPEAMDIDESARRAGAEWVLEVRGDRVQKDRLRLFATLRRVDRGLWAPPPNGDTTSIYALAENTVHLPAAAAPPPPNVDPPPTSETKTPKLVGPAVGIGKVPGRVIAIGACRMTEAETDQLVVVTDRAAIVFSYDRRRVRRIAQLDLSSYPLAPSRVRDPIGAATCGMELGGRRVVGVGTSELERGYVLSLTARRRGRFVLSVEHELPGIPLGRIGDDWILAWPDAGTNVWGASLARHRGDRPARFDARATYALAVLDGAWYAVSTGYDLLFGRSGLDAPDVLGKSGAAIATMPDPPLVVFSAAKLKAGADAITLRTVSETPSTVRVRAAIHALTIGRFREARTDVIAAAWRPAERQTDLFAIRVDGMGETP